MDHDFQATLVPVAGQLRWSFPPVLRNPLRTVPLQKPHPPIWVGKHSRAALRRTARHGDGWHPVGAVATSPLPPKEMRAHLDTLKQLTEAERRNFSALRSVGYFDLRMLRLAGMRPVYVNITRRCFVAILRGRPWPRNR
jgi:hypothetical protein